LVVTTPRGGVGGMTGSGAGVGWRGRVGPSATVAWLSLCARLLLGGRLRLIAVTRRTSREQAEAGRDQARTCNTLNARERALPECAAQARVGLAPSRECENKCRNRTHNFARADEFVTAGAGSPHCSRPGWIAARSLCAWCRTRTFESSGARSTAPQGDRRASGGSSPRLPVCWGWRVTSAEPPGRPHATGSQRGRSGGEVRWHRWDASRPHR